MKYFYAVRMDRLTEPIRLMAAPSWAQIKKEDYYGAEDDEGRVIVFMAVTNPFDDEAMTTPDFIVTIACDRRVEYSMKPLEQEENNVKADV